NAQLQTFAVHVCGHRVDAAWKLPGIRHQITARAALFEQPAVIDVHVDVACGFHTGGDHGVGGLLHQLCADIAVKAVPTVPAHRRRPGEPVVQCIGGSEGDHR